MGRVFSTTRAFTAEDVAAFARLSGDLNPIHLDEAAAAAAGVKGVDGRRVVHGMLCASLFSAIIGSRFPGAIYATQSLAFRRPVAVGEEVTAEVELVRLGGTRAMFATRVLRRVGGGAYAEGGGGGEVEVVLDGSAVALIRGVKRG